MIRKYKFHKKEAAHFVSFATVGRIGRSNRTAFGLHALKTK